MASLTTNPHGSRKVRVGTDGTTSTSHAAYTSRRRSGSSGPRDTIDESGACCAPARMSAASGELIRAARQADTSTGTPLPAAGRPTNRNLTSARAGQRGSLGGETSAERQKSLSTDCGATYTLRAPRALTYALTWGPYVTTASAERYRRRSGR